MKKLQIDKNLTRQVRIEAELHRLLKLKATDAGMSIKALLEGYIAEGLDKDNNSQFTKSRKPYKRRIIVSRKD